MITVGGILTLLLVLAIIGFALYAFNTWVTMIDPRVKQIINFVVIVVILVVVIAWLLQATGVWGVRISR